MSREKDKGDIMPVVIERIISIEHAETDAFIKKQKEELIRLREIERRQKEGKKVNIKPIVKGLQRAGILDKDGNLAHPYCDED